MYTPAVGTTRRAGLSARRVLSSALSIVRARMSSRYVGFRTSCHEPSPRPRCWTSDGAGQSTIRSLCYGNTAPVGDVRCMVCFSSGASGRLYKGVTGPLEAIEDMEDMRNILS